MSALTYLTLTRLKNNIKQLLHKPARLIYVLLMVALFVFVAVSGSGTGPIGETYRDPAELAAMATALYLFIFLFTVWNGFSKGGSIFSLSDVNLLFPSPISRTRALFYGLFRQISTSLLLGLFLFYQYSWMHNVYGAGFGILAVLFFGYVAAVFLGQVTAMTIYAFTSSNEKAQKGLKAVFLLGALFLVLWAVLGAWRSYGSSGSPLPGLAAVMGTLPVRLFPVGGWLGWAVSACWGQVSWLPGVLLCLVWFLFLVFLLTHFDRDWYEDVLRTAELAQSAIVSAKSGNLDATPRKIKVGKTGLNGGLGASAFYYKHRIENRRSGLLLLTPMTLIFSVILIAAAFFMKDLGILPIFSFAVYLQIFTVGQSRISKELYKPFVYLVPEPPFAKLLQCLRELLPSALAEALLVFIPVGLILGLPPVGIAVCVLARISYAFLFQSGNLLVERFWSGAGMALVFLFYFLVLIGLILPGIVLACVLTIALSLPSGVLTGLLIAALVNIPVSLLLLFLLRNMLQYAEYNH